MRGRRPAPLCVLPPTRLGSPLSTARVESEQERRPLTRRRISRRRTLGWPARLEARLQRPRSLMFSDPFHPSRDRHRTAGSGLPSATVPFPALARQRKADGRMAQRTKAERKAARPLTLAGGWAFVVDGLVGSDLVLAAPCVEPPYTRARPARRPAAGSPRRATGASLRTARRRQRVRHD